MLLIIKLQYKTDSNFSGVKTAPILAENLFFGFYVISDAKTALFLGEDFFLSSPNFGHKNCFNSGWIPRKSAYTP